MDCTREEVAEKGPSGGTPKSGAKALTDSKASYAALKGRSSTMTHAFVPFSATSKGVP